MYFGVNFSFPTFRFAAHKGVPQAGDCELAPAVQCPKAPKTGQTDRLSLGWPPLVFAYAAKPVCYWHQEIVKS